MILTRKGVTMSKPNGAILWQGASLIDGQPIVVIAVGLSNASSNRKTGAMLQTYILRADVDPNEAVRMGADASICGDCPHRGHLARLESGALRNAGRTCYVNVGQGPLSVWRAFKRGAYPAAIEYAGLYFARRENGDACIGKGRTVRLGTYGDPAAVPAHVWERLVKHAAGRTGYTHQWRNVNGRMPWAHIQALRGLCMASVDSEADAKEAQSLGWRTFRVAMPGDLARLPVEAICPASAEAGKKLTCAQCLACNGANGRRGSIVIQAHGGFAVMANVSRLALEREAAQELLTSPPECSVCRQHPWLDHECECWTHPKSREPLRHCRAYRTPRGGLPMSGARQALRLGRTKMQW
jgi:hypothetical protein